MKKYRATSQRVVLFLAFVSLIFTGASQGLVNAAGSFLVPPSDDLPALDGVCSPAEYADANPATFTVNAIPWGEVFVDGESLGPTPIVKYKTKPGNHELVISRLKYEKHKEKITVYKSETTVLSIKLIDL